jgi:hypothetical protein
VALSVTGCKLASPLESVDPNHPATSTGNTGNAGSSNGGSGNGGNAGSGNSSCPVCSHQNFDCTVGTSTGQATIVTTTSKGCTGSIGDSSESSPLWIDCDAEQVCVDQEDTCYDATLGSDGFTYQVTGGNTVMCTAGSSTVMPGCDEVEILVDGGFDDGSGAWIEVSTNGFPLIQDATQLDAVSPQSGGYAAWLGGAPLEDSGLAQPVFIPEGTVSLTVAGYFGLTTSDTGLNDYATIAVGSEDTGVNAIMQMWDPRNAVTPWVAFSGTTDAADLAGLSLTFLIASTTDDAANTNFFFDSLSLKATVCE